MILRFEECELDTGVFELRRGGAPVDVQPQVFDLLRHLVEHRDRMVSKDELFSAVWPDRIVSDSALSSQIKAARRAIGDDGTAQRLIKTVHGRGFRFVAEVSVSGDDAAGGAPPEAPGGLPRTPLRGGSHAPSVAVLPFADMSGASGQEYLSDGITDDITTALSKFRWLTVAARHSALAYRQQQSGPREMAAELGVHYLVRGSVRRTATRLRINCELIDARSATTAWAERYDGEPTDMFDVQDEIITSIVGALGQEIDATERKKALGAPTDNLDAWELYQRGMWHFGQYSRAEAGHAREFLRQAVAIDPGLANAHAALALLRAVEVFNAWSDASPDDLLKEAMEHAEAGIRADDQDTFTHYAMGQVLNQSGQPEKAIIEFRRALDLNRNHALAHFGLGATLHWRGDHKEALPHFDQAMKLSPNHPVRWAFDVAKGMALSRLGRHDDALELLQRSRSYANIDAWPHICTAAALIAAGRPDDAQQVIAELLDVRPGFSRSVLVRSISHFEPGLRAEFLDQLEQAGLPA